MVSLFIQETSRELCGVVASVRGAQSLACTPEAIRQLVFEAYNKSLQTAISLGSTRERGRVVLYPFVALVDEVLLRGPVELREYWRANLLQARIYGNTRAGEDFFTRLRASSDPEVRYAYLLALSLGFEGKYAGGDSSELVRERELLFRQFAERPTLHANRSSERLQSSRVSPRFVAFPVAVLACVLIHIYMFRRVEQQVSQFLQFIEHVYG